LARRELGRDHAPIMFAPESRLGVLPWIDLDRKLLIAKVVARYFYERRRLQALAVFSAVEMLAACPRVGSLPFARLDAWIGSGIASEARRRKV